MTSSLAAVPKSIVEPTGPYNWIEIFKFTRLCVTWIALIFLPVWLACWAVGELPTLIVLATTQGSAPSETATAVVEVLQALVPITAVMVFIPINAMFMVLCERRALALFTVRKGPNRVGPDGLLQTAADAVKLLFKEDITPTGADPVMFTLAPILFFAPSIFGAMPLLAAVTFNHPLFQTMQLPTGIFFVLAMAAIPTVALVMGGWASNNKYSLVGGLRSAAQAISYEIPLVMAIITTCYMAMGSPAEAGGYNPLDVVHIAILQNIRTTDAATSIAQLQELPSQYVFTKPDTPIPPVAGVMGQPTRVPAAPRSPGFLHWNVFGPKILDKDTQQLRGVLEFDWKAAISDPGRAVSTAFAHLPHIIAAVLLAICSFLLMGVYLIGACAEINRIPFDLPEAESELVSGYNTEYSGIKFAIFFLAEFTNLFIVATIATVMFFGGGASPIPGFLDPWAFQKAFVWIGGILASANVSTDFARILGSLLNPVTLSQWFWAVVKVYSIVIFAILVRGTLPRFRIDQLMDFS
ncbi:MAG TPA: complex I subunit 1 family protein, partial [Candidatus Obscuribacterales bacterium]